jgi:hypothetical protein
MIRNPSGEPCEAGGEYEGEYDSSGEQHGRGKYTYPNGTVFEGDWVNGVAVGQGIFIYPDGSKFEGGIKNGQRDGQFVCVLASGDRYEGTWIDGAQNGFGTIE